MRHARPLLSLVPATGATFVLLIAPAAVAGDFAIMDQIGGPGASQLAFSSSSSQHPIGDPQGAFSTVDDFSTGDAVRVTTIEGVVGGLQNFVSFDLIESWTVNIYSSLDAAANDFFGDVFTQTFDTPDNLTSGFSFLFGDPFEIATFEVDVILPPGDYVLGITMENDGAVNGTVGIRGSTIGNGDASFAVPEDGEIFTFLDPSAYRIMATQVPAPPVAALMGMAALAGRRRRRA